jgi:magnesium-transporting ATPase (P-type)
MRAGISVWVLTGDKQDTAINIGQVRYSFISTSTRLTLI